MDLRKGNNIDGIRLMSAEQGQKYVGLGRHNFRNWADSIGATRHFGRRVMFDKNVIDKALDRMNSGLC